MPRLGRGISPLTYKAAYAPFKPSNSEQRLPHTYYRGCWHVFSRGFLWKAVKYAHLRYVPFPSPDSSLQPESLLPARGVASSDLRPL